MDVSSLTAQTLRLTQVSTLAHRYARRFLILGDFDDIDAGDIAQDIVLECLAGLRSGKGATITAGVPRFVQTMVLRRVYNAWRANRRRDARNAECLRECTASAHVWMSPDLGLNAADLDTLFERTVAALPPMCQRVYLMLREDGASYREVTRALGISRNTVCGYLSTAQRRFRAALLAQDLCRSERSEGPALGPDLSHQATHACEQRDDVAA